MASETDPSFFIPYLLGLAAPAPPQEAQDPPGPRDRVIVINPLTQSMAVFETDGGPSGLDSLFGDLFSGKTRQRPASKAAIDSLPRVEVARGENECAVCLEEWVEGETAKEMPCKHRFHGGCIEKWLGINGCCPVCRREMPAGEEDDAGRKGDERERRREIWVSFSFGGLRFWENRETED